MILYYTGRDKYIPRWHGPRGRNSSQGGGVDNIDACVLSCLLSNAHGKEGEGSGGTSKKKKKKRTTLLVSCNLEILSSASSFDQCCYLLWSGKMIYHLRLETKWAPPSILLGPSSVASGVYQARAGLLFSFRIIHPVGASETRLRRHRPVIVLNVRKCLAREKGRRKATQAVRHGDFALFVSCLVDLLLTQS